MALALILALEHQPDGIRVRFDIGKNRYLRWQLGEEETITRNGLPALATVRERSQLIGPLRPETRGRGEFTLPVGLVNRDTRWLQVFSYRDAEGNGPAMSAVTTIPITEVSRTEPDLPPPAGLALAQNRMKDGHMIAESRAFAHQVDNAPFRLRERPLSRPLFLEAIVGALPSLLPMLAPAIGSFVSGVAPAVGQVAGQLIRSLSGAGGGGGSGATRDSGAATAVSQIGTLAEQALRALGPAAQQILTPDNMRQILQLIQAGANAAPAAAAPAPAAAPAAAPATAHSLSATARPRLPLPCWRHCLH
ncbi:MAG: hypothetical protein R3F38_00405 [Gammaproteobacteria bacterium]